MCVKKTLATVSHILPVSLKIYSSKQFTAIGHTC